jgi:hypothetical protein
MTQANLSSVPWANGGFVVDPDTDAAHPSGEGGAGKVAKGWLVETEPQQWENWVINRYQNKMLNRVVSGVHQIDHTVTYKSNSLVWDVNGKVYRAKVSNTNKPTTDAPSWEEAISYSQAAWLAITNQMATDYTNHIPTNVIKHGETIAQAGGKTSGAIDTQIANVRAPLDSHVGAHYPHHETAIQCGTIPSTGGEFTGRITYAQGYSMSDYDEITINDQTEIAGMGLPNGSAFGVGYANFEEGGRIQELVTTTSYAEMEARYGQLYKAPTPDVWIPLVSDLRTLGCEHTLTLLRPNTLSYTSKAGATLTAAADQPAFETLGLKIDGFTQLLLGNWPWGIIDIATIVYRVNGNKMYTRQKYSPNLFPLQWLASTGDKLQDVRIWFQSLTDKQIANLP